MILIILLIILSIFFLCVGATRLIINSVSKTSISNNSQRSNLTVSKKGIAIGISVLVTIFIIFLWISKTTSFNYKQANIKNEKGEFIITVFGRRELMVHDPVSFFKGETYEDSMKLKIPIRQGKIEASNVINLEANYKYVKGSINITNNKAQINLFYVDAYYDSIIASTWNGSYELGLEK
jgi:hypothetical protein